MLIESTSDVIEKNKGDCGGGCSGIGKKEKNLNEGQRKKNVPSGTAVRLSLSVSLSFFLCHTPVSHLHIPRQQHFMHGLV